MVAFLVKPYKYFVEYEEKSSSQVSSPTDSHVLAHARKHTRRRAKTLKEHTHHAHAPVDPEKARHRSESSPTPPGAAGAELVPTFERILRKSPSLARKLGQSEVIACHSPSSSAAAQDSDDVTSPQQQQQPVAARQQELAKATSVPSLVLSNSPPAVDGGSGGCALTEGAPVAIYAQEGIEWSPGTVRHQLQTKFEPLLCSTTDAAAGAGTDAAGGIVTASHNDFNHSYTKQTSLTSQSPEHSAAMTSKDSSRVTPHVAAGGPLSSGRTEQVQQPTVIIIEKSKQPKSAFVSRAKSLGSKQDLKSTSVGQPCDVSGGASVNRASSFESKTRGQQLANRVPSKRIVIIPKVDQTCDAVSQAQAAPLPPSGGGAAAAATKLPCDKPADGARDVMSCSASSSSSSGGSTEDISVKELRDMFESKDNKQKPPPAPATVTSSPSESSKSAAAATDVATTSQSTTVDRRQQRDGTRCSGMESVTPRKSRKLQHGKTHPLSRLKATESGSQWGRFYSTM